MLRAVACPDSSFEKLLGCHLERLRLEAGGGREDVLVTSEQMVAGNWEGSKPRSELYQVDSKGSGTPWGRLLVNVPGDTQTWKRCKGVDLGVSH